MCGFAGFLSSGVSGESKAQILQKMGQSLFHRGPDNIDVFSKPDSDLGMVHTRLSILDLSSAGSQPLESHSGRYIISYNGEIYNYLEIKEELIAKGVKFRGGSDTEVLIEAIEVFGLTETLQKIRGMFAFAIFDFKNNILSLCRDRAGEKPLYYFYKNGTIVFASELKALMCWPQFSKKINKHALTQFLSHGFISSGHSIFENVIKVPPSSVIKFKMVKGFWTEVEKSTYWSLLGSSQSVVKNSSLDYIDQLDGLLSSAVNEQMIADVPVGAFLSGGIDSSLTVALMSRSLESKVKTFSIGFDDKEYNEAEHAKRVAAHLGTTHETLYVNDNELMDIIPRLPKIYDEPMADMSQIPTFIVSKLARSKVTVALTGDAGDELFGGYNRYLWVDKMSGINQFLPSSVRVLISRLLMNISPSAYDFISRLLPSKYQISEFGIKAHKALRSFSATDNVVMYHQILNQFSSTGIFSHNPSFNFVIEEQKQIFYKLTPSDQFMVLDFMNYMTDGVLCKVDRAAMANSLETRAPFLDRRIIEFGMNLPSNMKIRNGESKWILRRLLERYVPNEMFERPKMGFAVPMGNWLRGPLKDWSFEMLQKHKHRLEGVIDSRSLDMLWENHQNGKQNYQTQIWTIITLFQWFEEYLD